MPASVHAGAKAALVVGRKFRGGFLSKSPAMHPRDRRRTPGPLPGERLRTRASGSAGRPGALATARTPPPRFGSNPGLGDQYKWTGVGNWLGRGREDPAGGERRKQALPA